MIQKIWQIPTNLLSKQGSRSFLPLEEAKGQRKEREILATWFLREEYLNAGWFKRFLLRLEFLFRDTRGESHIPQIPEHIRKEIARCLLPDIVAYFESEQGQREFETWKKSRTSINDVYDDIGDNKINNAK